MGGWCLLEKSDFILSNLLTEIIKLLTTASLAGYLYIFQQYPYLWLIPLAAYGGYQLGKWRYTRKPQLHFLPDTFPQSHPAYISTLLYSGMLWYVWLPKRDQQRDNMKQYMGIPPERIMPQVSGHPICPRCRTELEESPFLGLHIFRCPQEDCAFIVYRMKAPHNLYHAAKKIAVKKFEDGSLRWHLP